jgi:hypothetical protein
MTALSFILNLLDTKSPSSAATTAAGNLSPPTNSIDSTRPLHVAYRMVHLVASVREVLRHSSVYWCYVMVSPKLLRAACAVPPIASPHPRKEWRTGTIRESIQFLVRRMLGAHGTSPANRSFASLFILIATDHSFNCRWWILCEQLAG